MSEKINYEHKVYSAKDTQAQAVEVAREIDHLSTSLYYDVKNLLEKLADAPDADLVDFMNGLADETSDLIGALQNRYNFNL